MCAALTWNQSMTCCTVRSPVRIHLSQRVHLMPLNSTVFGGIGSAIANRGRARFANVLRYASISLPCSTLYSSKHTNPANMHIKIFKYRPLVAQLAQVIHTIHSSVQAKDTNWLSSALAKVPVAKAVAVAMAGMILPAINFAFSLSTSAMP